jgi:hypothetical protein
MRELMGRMRAWPPSIGQVCACPTGRRVADGEEERLATKDSAHTADLRNLASDPGGGAGTARGTGSAGARRPGCGPSHRDEKREEQRAPAGQQVAPGSRGRRCGTRWRRAAEGAGGAAGGGGHLPPQCCPPLVGGGGRWRGQQVAAASS